MEACCFPSDLVQHQVIDDHKPTAPDHDGSQDKTNFIAMEVQY